MKFLIVSIVAILVILLFALNNTWLQQEQAANVQERPIVRILIVGDPFASVLEKIGQSLVDDLGIDLRIERAGYDAIRQTILGQAAFDSPIYDLVAFDALWTAELAERHLLTSLGDSWSDQYPEARAELYLPKSIEAITWQGKQYGLPIQPHAELLWYRSDWLQEKGLSAPRTTDELLSAAKILHCPDENMYGIVWNGQRGSALGQTVSHMYAAFGSSILDLDGRPQIDSPAGQEVALYLRELVKYSPPDILTTAWDQRRNRFFAGQAAFAYGWGARFGESLRGYGGDAMREVTKVQVAPAQDGLPLAVPFGSWNIGIPAGLSGKRLLRAEQALAAIAGQVGARSLAENGNPGVAVSSLLADKKLSAGYNNLFAIMSELNARHSFSDTARPVSPLWNDVALILGRYFHDYLRGDLSLDQMLATAQSEALRLNHAGTER